MEQMEDVFSQKVNGFTKVIIDTNGFIQVQSDFLGIKNKDIIRLTDLLKEKNIKLLNHSILEQEIIKHTDDSKVLKDYQNITSNIAKYKEVLKTEGVEDSQIDLIAQCNLKQRMVDAFNSVYTQAVKLDYPNPEIIFNQYFKNKRPFQESGKKKHEFPDAFVIQSIRDYVNHNREEIVLAVTDDGDWIEALRDCDRVICCDSIGKAIGLINEPNKFLSKNAIKSIIVHLNNEIEELAEMELLGCSYYIDDEFEDVYIGSVLVDAISEDVITILITEDRLIVRLNVELIINGDAIEFDYDNSVWDSVDKEYVIKNYKDFSFTGKANKDIDVYIDYDKDDYSNNMITNVEIVDDSDIDVELEDIVEIEKRYD